MADSMMTSLDVLSADLAGSAAHHAGDGQRAGRSSVMSSVSAGQFTRSTMVEGLEPFTGLGAADEPGCGPSLTACGIEGVDGLAQLHEHVVRGMRPRCWRRAAPRRR